MSGVDVGVRCGKCKGTVHMIACPEHHWTVSSVCVDCGHTNVVAATCAESAAPANETGCDWPKEVNDAGLSGERSR